MSTMKKLVNILFILILFYSFPAKSQPVLEWARTYNTPGGGGDVGLAIIIDHAYNVYITGGASGDVGTIKYNSSGVQQWITRFNGIENGNDYGRGIVLDRAGNIYTGGGYLIKYRNNGDTVWTRRFIGIGSGGDKLNIDSMGYLYSSGININDYATIKYDSDGNVIWQRFLNGPGNGNETVYDQAIDKWNNVIVTGRVTDNNDPLDYSAGTVKYSPNGDTMWTHLYNNPDNAIRPWDQANACTVDDSGNVYVTGYARAGNGIVGDCLIIKYKPNGDIAWTRLYGDEIPGESGEDIEVDKTGNVYIAVRIEDNINGVIKYNTDGVFQWIRTFPVFFYTSLPLLKLDSQGNVYITTPLERVAGFSDLRVTKYNPAGDLIWYVLYPGSGPSTFYAAEDMAIDNLNNVYVTGTGYNNTITVKYSQTTGIEPISNEIPLKFNLSQNYPNPFNPVTKINYTLPTSTYVSLKVYDVLGNEIETLIMVKQNAGNHSAAFDGSGIASGIYFYKLVTDNFSETKKMILIK